MRKLKTTALLALAATTAVGCGSDTPDDAGSTSVVTTVAAATTQPTTAGTTADTTADTTASTPDSTTDSTPDSTIVDTTRQPSPSESPTTEAPDTTPVETAPAETTSTLPAPNTVAVGLADYSITMPAALPSGPTRFEAANTGLDEHHLSIIRLEDGQDVGDVLTALATDPAGAAESAELYPGPQSVAPGATNASTVTLQPGEYLALCVIPGADGIPHAAKGMLTQFTVTGDESDAPSAPESPAIVLADYGFTLPDGFTGQGLVRVHNNGSLAHEMSIYRVVDGKTYADATAFLLAPTKDFSTPPPIIPSGGITALDAGEDAGVELNLAPGTYVFVCFIPGSDHLSHMEHGMIREVVIS